jgi:hypothetical protein
MNGICEYSGDENFYCNWYRDDNEIVYINPYNGDQNFTVYIINEKEESMVGDDIDNYLMRIIIFLNILFSLVVFIVCARVHCNMEYIFRRRYRKKVL